MNKKNIYLTFEGDWLLYHFIDENTARIEIESNSTLSDIADDIRIKEGYKPFFKDNTEVHDDGWYDFYLLVDISKKKITELTFDVVGNTNVVWNDKEDCPDDEETYDITDYVNLDNALEQLINKLNEMEFSFEALQKEAQEEYMED